MGRYGLCNFCGSDNVVLITGYHYCPLCLYRYDQVCIHNDISLSFPSLTLDNIKQICGEIFGTDKYNYSMFPRLYIICHRGAWIKDTRSGYFAIPQIKYIGMVVKNHTKLHHPHFYKRIENDQPFEFNR